jgi:pimeloyl-ACP methyl ester carboxylesterase
MVHELDTVLLRVAGGKPVILVGHSFGSFLVLAYAVRFVDRVAGIVLVDPAVEWLTLTPERRRLIRGAAQLSRLGGLLARLGVVRLSLALLTGGAPGVPRRFVKVFGPTAARTLERLVGEVRKLPPEVHPQVRAIWCSPKPFAAMAAHLQALEREAATLASTLPLGAVPITVISAADQPPEVRAAQQGLATGSSAGRHIVAPGTGHWVQFDAPDVIVQAVKALVDAAGRPPG